MEHHNTVSPDVTFEHHQDSASFKKRVIKTTIILSVITLVELGIGFILYFLHKGGGTPSEALVLALKGTVCILTLAKAYYIVSIFMHLGDELRSFIMTIVLPLLLFIWFIIAFLWDGHAFKTARNKFDKHFYETTMPRNQGIQSTPAAAPVDTLNRQ